MSGVRFLLPKTNEVVFPGPWETVDDPINVPNVESQDPPMGSLLTNPALTPQTTLQWDVRHPVASLGVERFNEAATSPPMARLELESPQLPWKVEVFPRTPNIHVTVHDVLATIHKTLRGQITRGEWERFNDTRKHSVLVARGQRVQDYEFGRMLDEFYIHPRRIDSLGECTRFGGLVPAPYRGSNSFDLEFVRRG